MLIANSTYCISFDSHINFYYAYFAYEEIESLGVKCIAKGYIASEGQSLSQ